MSRFESSRCVPPPDQELICAICMNILDGPMETPCRHVFCSGCITKALSKSKKCPVCRRPCKKIQLRKVVPLIQNLVNKLLMKCDHYDKGCVDLIPLEFFLNHEKSCMFELVNCKYEGCGQRVQRQYLEQHQNEQCKYRMFKCQQDCGFEGPWKEKDSHNCFAFMRNRILDLERRQESLEKEVTTLKSILLALQVEPDKNQRFKNVFSSVYSSESERSWNPRDEEEDNDIEQVSSISTSSSSNLPSWRSQLTSPTTIEDEDLSRSRSASQDQSRSRSPDQPRSESLEPENNRPESSSHGRSPSAQSHFSIEEIPHQSPPHDSPRSSNRHQSSASRSHYGSPLANSPTHSYSPSAFFGPGIRSPGNHTSPIHTASHDHEPSCSYQQLEDVNSPRLQISDMTSNDQLVVNAMTNKIESTSSSSTLAAMHVKAESQSTQPNQSRITDWLASSGSSSKTKSFQKVKRHHSQENSSDSCGSKPKKPTCDTTETPLTLIDLSILSDNAQDEASAPVTDLTLEDEDVEEVAREEATESNPAEYQVLTRRRSARLQGVRVDESDRPVHRIRNVEVPPTAAELLEKYVNAEQSSSSEDETWSPPSDQVEDSPIISDTE